MHPLDNIIWQALTTRQGAFAQSFGETRRFVPDVGPLAAFRDPNNADYESLAGLAKIGGTIAVFLDLPYQPRSGWNVVAGAPLLQMLHAGDKIATPAQVPHSILELAAADSAEMVALAALTKPGPFGPRTHELGNFFGSRVEGKLVAMAGERMKVPGHTELSAVCTQYCKARRSTISSRAGRQRAGNRTLQEARLSRTEVGILCSSSARIANCLSTDGNLLPTQSPLRRGAHLFEPVQSAISSPLRWPFRPSPCRVNSPPGYSSGAHWNQRSA